MADAKGWADLIDRLYAEAWDPGLARFRSPFAFRGLSCPDHGLSSSLCRLAAGHDPERFEAALLRNVRKYAHHQVAHRGDSVWHWLAVGQHHGLPTRLMHWTYSPLVALHFATADPVHRDDDGVVWCVNFVEANRRLPARLRRMLEDEHSDTFTVEMLERFATLRDFDALGRRPFVVFVEPPSLDSRILNQWALFSLMPGPAAGLDDWVRAHPGLCRRVVVPAGLKAEVRDKLDQANITERTLFPGLDGLSRWLQRYYSPTPEALASLSGRNRRQGLPAPAGRTIRRRPQDAADPG